VIAQVLGGIAGAAIGGVVYPLVAGSGD